MKIIVLVDNNSAAMNLRKRNSMSFYIETGNHKILFDVGSNSLFATNGSKLSVDISKVDSVVLSTGYADLGGGLKTFMELNDKASIYVHRDAFVPHYTTRMGVKLACGLDANLKDNPNLVFTNNLYFLDDSIQLFSNVSGQRFSLKSNSKYYSKENGNYAEDTFNHEQYLLIEENGKNVLFLGNPYNGVANVVKRIESIANIKADYIFTGFQLLEEALKKEENAEQINEIMKELKERNCKFYTSKQNGKEAIRELESNIKEQLTYFYQGDHITI